MGYDFDFEEICVNEHLERERESNKERMNGTDTVGLIWFSFCVVGWGSCENCSHIFANGNVSLDVCFV